jgi:HPt (histidine-containing phosphotransfer) domain-containing protein
VVEAASSALVVSAARWQSQAHALKGAAATLGLHELKAQAQRLEALARQAVGAGTDLDAAALQAAAALDQGVREISQQMLAALAEPDDA